MQQGQCDYSICLPLELIVFNLLSTLLLARAVIRTPTFHHIIPILSTPIKRKSIAAHVVLKCSGQCVLISSLCKICFIVIDSDVCLEAEASPRGSLEAAKVLPRPRPDVFMPRLGLASVSMLWSLSYVTISLFITFIHSSFVHVLKTFKTKLHLGYL